MIDWSETSNICSVGFILYALSRVKCFWYACSPSNCIIELRRSYKKQEP